MTTYIYIARSLDGFIADRDGGVDWLNNIPNPDNSDFGFAEFMGKIDGIVMGRKTFEQVLTFGSWPYPRPVYVVSSSLKEVPPEYSGKAEIINLEPAEIIKKLRSNGMKSLYIDGGALIQSFLTGDLIDEMIITSIPVLLGAGIPLFGELSNSLEFTHYKTEVLINSLVKSHYKRKK